MNSRAIVCMRVPSSAVGVEHHGQRIAAEALIGEHVEDVIVEAASAALSHLRIGAHIAGFRAAFQAAGSRYPNARHSGRLLNYFSKYFNALHFMPGHR